MNNYTTHNALDLRHVGISGVLQHFTSFHTQTYKNKPKKKPSRTWKCLSSLLALKSSFIGYFGEEVVA